MKNSIFNCCPDSPLYIISFPVELYPIFLNNVPNNVCFGPLFTNAVQSPNPP